MSIDSSARYISETIPSFRKGVVENFVSGAFSPIIDTVLPVSDIVEAHQMVESRKHFGKIILSVREG
jgi:NADPH:quinone reductase-like Zn-dependent oxidoreductase